MKYLKKGDLIWLTEVDKEGSLVDNAYYKILDIKDNVILTLKGRYSHAPEYDPYIKVISLYTTNICKHTNEWMKRHAYMAGRYAEKSIGVE